jgi:hypothetical protein
MLTCRACCAQLLGPLLLLLPSPLLQPLLPPKQLTRGYKYSCCCCCAHIQRSHAQRAPPGGGTGGAAAKASPAHPCPMPLPSTPQHSFAPADDGLCISAGAAGCSTGMCTRSAPALAPKPTTSPEANNELPCTATTLQRKIWRKTPKASARTARGLEGKEEGHKTKKPTGRTLPSVWAGTPRPGFTVRSVSLASLESRFNFEVGKKLKSRFS